MGTCEEPQELGKMGEKRGREGSRNGEEEVERKGRMEGI